MGVLLSTGGALKYGNEPWGSIKGIEYLDYLRGCQLLNEVIALMITGLFNDAFKCSDFIMSNGRMNNEL
jgi:hypothetical protein